mmetsp:Transcript_28377/g.48685  ORF Transcript_28377/g.48685 Transcript_28377/m.48685 type:complete len:260 (-) Transcript_28377:424-1203(-)
MRCWCWRSSNCCCSVSSRSHCNKAAVSRSTLASYSLMLSSSAASASASACRLRSASSRRNCTEDCSACSIRRSDMLSSSCSCRIVAARCFRSSWRSSNAFSCAAGSLKDSLDIKFSIFGTIILKAWAMAWILVCVSFSARRVWSMNSPFGKVASRRRYSRLLSASNCAVGGNCIKSSSNSSSAAATSVIVMSSKLAEVARDLPLRGLLAPFSCHTRPVARCDMAGFNFTDFGEPRPDFGEGDFFGDGLCDIPNEAGILL